MRKLINLIALLIMASSVTWAQDKKSFTLEDLMPGGNNYYNLLPQNLYGLQWWGDVCINADIEEVKTIQPANGKENVLITLQEVNELLANKELGKINHFRNASFPYAEKMMLVNTTSNKVLIDLTKKEIIWSQPLSPKAANQDWNKESRSLAYTLDNNLFVTTADGKTQQVTDEPKGIVCGQSVHRQEFGISKGTFWSPKGNLLAFYRMDESMVTDYPQVNTSTRIATLEPDKYPMAGMTSHKVTVGIYNPETQKTVYLKAGDPTDRYFTNISWSPDEKSVYVIELNRDQNHALHMPQQSYLYKSPQHHNKPYHYSSCHPNKDHKYCISNYHQDHKSSLGHDEHSNQLSDYVPMIPQTGFAFVLSWDALQPIISFLRSTYSTAPKIVENICFLQPLWNVQCRKCHSHKQIYPEIAILSYLLLLQVDKKDFLRCYPHYNSILSIFHNQVQKIDDALHQAQLPPYS